MQGQLSGDACLRRSPENPRPQRNNAQGDGAASLESALAQHQDGLTDGGVDATQVNAADWVPEPVNDSTSQQPAEPLGQPTRQSGAPVPGELIEVDLPDEPDEKPEDGRKNDGGDGGLLGRLFGKK